MSEPNVRWTDFAPAETSREREQIEWSVNYAYNAVGSDLPRALLIGDSICNAYQGRVRELLEGRVNVSFWASSKCVTDPDYFRELDLILSARHYDIVTFNNGLHSLSTDREEWVAAYEAAVSFLRAKLPDAKLSIVLCTPLADEKLTAICAELNETALRVAEQNGLPIVDLFAPMDALERAEYWTDTFHFRTEAVDMQAKAIASHCLAELFGAD